MFNFDKYFEYVKSVVPEYRDAFMKDFEPGSAYVNGAPIRMDVINFIADMLYNTGADPRSIHVLFKCGYCYHFAVILEHEFGGRIMWVVGDSHLVWVDDNNLAYDIEGYRNDLTIDMLHSADDMDFDNNELESFRHRYLNLRPE